MTLLRFFNQHSAFLAALALVAALEALFGAASWPLVLALALLLSLGWWWARQRDSAASDARLPTLLILQSATDWRACRSCQRQIASSVAMMVAFGCSGWM